MKLFLTLLFTAMLLAVPSAPAELIRHWVFDGNFNESIAGNHGTPINGASFGSDRFGDPGKALSVDGSLEQYVRVDGGGGLNNLQEGSISMFVRWSGAQDSNGFSSTANVTGRQKNSFFNNQVLGLSSSNPAQGRVTWQPYSFGTLLTGTTPVGDGAWRHVVVTYSPGAHTIYLDGEIDAASALTGTMQDDATVALSIGAWIDHGGGYASGQIDDLRIYDHVLSQSEIRALALPVPVGGLLAYYPFSGNADDASGNANHGTVTGATLAADALGNPDSAYHFGGAGDSIEIPGYTGSYPTGSVAAWVTAEGYDTGFNQLNLIFGQNDNLQLGLGDSSLGADGQWIFRHRSAGGFVNPSGPLPNLRRWTHVAGVWTGDDAILYLDGAEVSRIANGVLLEGAAPARIGAHPYAAQNYWRGKIDELVLYDRALDLTEIQGLAAAYPTDLGLALTLQQSPVPMAALEWNSTPGAQFRVGYSDDLKVWKTGSLVIGQAGQNRAMFSSANDSIARRFYRIERLLGDRWNLASGKSISTNAFFSTNVAELAIDGDRDTQWSSTDHGTPGDPNWLKLDLGSVQDIGHVFVWFVYTNGTYEGYNNLYELYGSQDDSDYTLIASGTLTDTADYEGRSDTIALPPDARSYRYLRYDVVGGNHWSGLLEFEVYPPGG